MSSNQRRTITIPAGIGDAIWIFQKLANQPEKFHIVLPDGTPQRGHQILELLPNVVASYEYASALGYNKIKENNIQAKKKQWSMIQQKEFYLSANAWLEAGRRLEGWLPDLPISYKMEYATTDKDTAQASDLLPAGRHYIGIYASAYANTRHAHYNGWGPDEWLSFIKAMYSQNRDQSFVIIGAPYDQDLAHMLMHKLYEYRIPYIDTIGQPLRVVVELLKRLAYFVGFPSGLSILNETLGKDGVMFYGQKVAGIINTWADPERIATGSIKECLFCEPQKIFDWIKHDYQLFKRLQ